MHGEYKMPGGKLVVIDLEARDGHLAHVQLSGDFFLEPDQALHAINRAPDGLSVDLGENALADTVRGALPTGTQMYGISPEAVAMAVRRALLAEAR